MYLCACSSRILGESAKAILAIRQRRRSRQPLNLSGKRVRIREQSGERFCDNIGTGPPTGITASNNGAGNSQVPKTDEANEDAGTFRGAGASLSYLGAVVMKHFAVIGAGITGVTTAWALRQKGFEVTVFDKHRYPAMETSFANGGQLSASNAEVWTNINTILKGLKWLFKADAPLAMNIRPSWHKYSWLAEFASNIGNYEKHTIATAKLAIDSREVMTAFAEEAGLSFDRVDRGILHFYKSEAEFAHAHNVTAMLAKAGLSRRRLTANEVYDIEPALNAPVIGGYYTDSDFTGDIHKFATGLAEAARQQGVTFVMNTEVDTIKHQDGEPQIFWTGPEGQQQDKNFDGVVVTAGVMSRKLAAQLGDRVNIYPVKGYSITVELNDESHKPQPQLSACWMMLRKLSLRVWAKTDSVWLVQLRLMALIMISAQTVLLLSPDGLKRISLKCQPKPLFPGPGCGR